MRRSRAAGCVSFGILIVALAGGVSAEVGAARETSRTFRFHYSVAVERIPQGAHALSIWIPVPKTDRHQQVLDLEVRAPFGYTITREQRHGNHLLHMSAAAPLPKEIELRFEALISRRAYSVLAGEPRIDDDPPTARDLGPDSLVPIDGKIAAAAREAAGNARTPLEKARAIYDYVTSTVRYDTSGPGWGRGDAARACDIRSGNCTDFHSLIIGMARASHIPARFVMGFPLPGDRTEGEIAGYHCWAELYLDDIGWLPLDSSEASRHPEHRDRFFGRLDANRVQFTRGRDLQLEPPASERLNFFVYPRVEVDGVEHTEVRQRFSFAEIKT